MSDRPLEIKFEGGPCDGDAYTLDADSANEIFARKAECIYVTEGEKKTVYDLKHAEGDVQTYAIKA